MLPSKLGVARRTATDNNRERFGERIGCIIDCFEEQGIKGMYRGISPSLFALGMSNFIFYFIFQGFKRLLSYIKLYIQLRRSRKLIRSKGFSGQRNLEDLFTSMMAGVINVILTNPFWVAVTVMKKSKHKLESENCLDQNGSKFKNSSSSVPKSSTLLSDQPETSHDDFKGVSGMFQLIGYLSRRDGCKSLWKGCTASLVLVSNPTIHFAVYEGLKRMTLARYSIALFYI